MRRLIVICEGPTEQEFCHDVLAPHLSMFNIDVVAPVVKKSNGGIVPWASLRPQIMNHLRENEAYVTMLVDYYGIKDHFKFPGWEESVNIVNKQERIHFLLERMKLDLPEEVRYRFFPYIQLHEFEGLLFSDIKAFKECFDESEVNLSELESTMAQFATPEDINNSPTTAPSKRLIAAIPGYNKIVYGSILAELIGIEQMRNKCPLFDEWIGLLEKC